MSPQGEINDPLELVALCAAQFGAGALAGRRVVVSAGPTFEDIDPVRFIGNRSSGRMGYAIAQAAREAGAEVTLVTGPVALADPSGVAVQRVRSALQMRDAVLAAVATADVYVGTAAVADYRPAAPAGRKIKKDRDALSVELIRNPDILSEVAALQRRPFTVGFAAETDDVLAYARRKLDDKRLDLIAANAVGAGLGFETDHNALTLLWPGGQRELPRASKAALARALMAEIAERLHARG